MHVDAVDFLNYPADDAALLFDCSASHAVAQLRFAALALSSKYQPALRFAQ